MSSADSLAFMLPFLMLTFGSVFLAVARWGSRPARLWGIGYLLLAGAFFAPVALVRMPAEVQALAADALFLAAFVLFGQALLLRFDQRRFAGAQTAFACAAMGVVACAIFEGSLRAELFLHDIACALLLVFPLLSIRRRLRRPIDKALFGLTALVAIDSLVRTGIFVFLIPSDAGLESFASSDYAFFMEASASMLGLLFALSALAAVVLDILAAYRDAAEYDLLTGLLNRRGFERAALAFSDRSALPGAVVTCDIDHFKAVNDSFGHGAGDRVIASLAGLLRSRLPTGGFAARFGGEEFVVVLPDREDAGAFAEAVRADFALRDWSEAGVGRPITASFGVSRPAPGDHSLHDAIARADRGLYAAKAAGRNLVVVDGGACAPDSRQGGPRVSPFPRTERASGSLISAIQQPAGSTACPADGSPMMGSKGLCPLAEVQGTASPAVQRFGRLR